MQGRFSELLEQVEDLGIDAFLCCASFEERSISIACALSALDISKFIVAQNLDFAEESAEQVQKVADSVGERFVSAETNTSDPLLTADGLLVPLESLFAGASKNVLIDITAFTREALLILLRLVNELRRGEDTVNLIYLNASEYSVGDAEDEKWLSRGIREVRSILSYPGEIVPSKRNHLIVLVGFEYQRALSLIQECEPSLVSLGICDENVEPTRPHQRTNELHRKRLSALVKAEQTFTFDGYDSLATASTLSDLARNCETYNTLIAPMNTKISTVGAAIAGMRDRRLQICYAQANVYNTANYSAPGEQFFLFPFDTVRDS
ncbi:hypothetical protein [Aeoliella sp.]|uniref:hypothetical protein n=1 Tax=Aeoliella sp. TaxID=2795800 RepID=UPI003CCBA7FF